MQKRYASRRFQPGEGPFRGLLHDCTTSLIKRLHRTPAPDLRSDTAAGRCKWSAMAISAISAPRLPGFANNLSSCSTGGGHGQFLSCENQLWDTRHRAVRRTTIGVSVPMPIGQRPWRQYFPRICTSSTWILPVFCRILHFFPWILMIANCHSGKYAHAHCTQEGNDPFSTIFWHFRKDPAHFTWLGAAQHCQHWTTFQVQNDNNFHSLGQVTADCVV